MKKRNIKEVSKIIVDSFRDLPVCKECGFTLMEGKRCSNTKCIKYDWVYHNKLIKIQ